MVTTRRRVSATIFRHLRYQSLHPVRHNATNAVTHAISPEAQFIPPNHDGHLSGKTIAIKDNIVTISSPTTAASCALNGYNSPFDATVVKLLRQHGASITAKTNLDEFGMGSHSQHSFHGALNSIYSRGDVPLSPGGSSGGSAIAVARGDVWAALGTDTGGSVRVPAAYTGTVGFKPSYGLLSRWGVIQYANSLDTVGVIARTVEDMKRVFNVLNAYDSQDPTSVSPNIRERLSNRKISSTPTLDERLRIGVPTTYNIAQLSPAVLAAYKSTLTLLQKAGHTLVTLSLPSTQQALSTYYVLAPAEASSNLAKYDGIRYGYRTSGSDAMPNAGLPLYAKTRDEAFGEEVKRRILLGAYTLSSEAMDNYFVQAQKVRRLVEEDFNRVFALSHPLRDAPAIATKDDEEAAVDIILMPTTPTLPPTIEEVKAQTPVERYMNDVFTVPASLACLPAANVPVALPEEVLRSLEREDVRTAGMQIVGQYGNDETVLKAAEMVEGLWHGV